MTRTMTFLFLASLPLLAMTGGCASTAGQSIRANAQTIRAEATADNLRERGDASASVNDMTRAEQYYTASLTAGGDPKALVRRLVRVCVADQRYRVAIEYAENYLRHYPNDGEVRFALATIQGAIGDVVAARENFERVLAQAPKDPDAHFAVALLLRDGLHDGIQADKHFRDYLALAPEGPHAEQAKANLLRRVKR